MPPTLILIRHAEAEHNKTKDYTLPDPDLTDLGRSQCQKLAEHLKETLPGKLDVELILVSPMKRCLQTALLSLDFLVNDKKIPIQAHAGWQENSDKPCDTGSPLNLLREEYPAVDFTPTDPVYPDKTSEAGSHYRYSRRALLNRAQTNLAELHGRPEKVIAIVSHSGFLRTSVVGCWFQNADYRVFDFKYPKEEGKPFELAQDESTHPAGGLGTCMTTPVPIGAGLPDDDGVYR